MNALCAGPADRFQVAAATAKRWADRYREHGAAGIAGRSSQPLSSPPRTRTKRRIIKVRLARRQGTGPGSPSPRAEMAALGPGAHRPATEGD